jgi:hypothetical protein
MRRITIIVSDDELATLHAVADDERRSLASLLRYIVARFIREQRKIADANVR